MYTMKRVQKKPVVVSALQLDFNNPDLLFMVEDEGFHLAVLDKDDNVEVLYKFDRRVLARLIMEGDRVGLAIPTLEDNGLAKHIASPGDWIIRGVKGEFYPCKPDIFNETYFILKEGPQA